MGGYIAWIKTDPRLVSEMHRRAAKAALREFKTCTYIPKIARERKAGVDRLLLDYKKENGGLWAYLQTRLATTFADM